LEWTALTPPIVMLEIARSYALMPSPMSRFANSGSGVIVGLL
jgi:hypothetical protein